MASEYLDYELIGPSHHYLSDEAVLYQAWRKSVEYVRRHNWYSDVLELDIASLDTRRVIRDCVTALDAKNWRAYSPDPMRLVPVPKRAEWKLDHGWKPIKPVRWRPLAHIRVRDQTLASAAMICLASLVETEQGDTRAPAKSADRDIHRHSMSSYGNRLHCRWTSKGAEFQWGNSKTYREYFQDYRAFIARPNTVIQEHSGRKLAIVHVDVERFYDCINRMALIEKLQALAKKKAADMYDTRFFDQLRRVFSWTWHKYDARAVDQHFADCADDGIPQGLVAGGFFANAYMLDFDRAMRRKLDEAPSSVGWQLIDYCRYVDDMRLVIKCNDITDLGAIKDDVVSHLQNLIQRHAPGLRINREKTDVLPVMVRPGVVQVGSTMESIQAQVSGPLDPSAANQVLATLSALFPIAEQAATRIPLQSDDGDELLRELQSAELDVRPDTVERFAAHRWKRVYRSLRAMTDQPDGGGSLELNALDEKARLFSLTLIRRWVSDPSNVRLLRVAFDVLPDVDNLDRYVLSLVRPPCFNQNAEEAIKFVSWYTISELLKAGATETGFVRDSDEMPMFVDVDAYRMRLAEVAEECQKHAKSIPWYLRQQSALFLLIHGKQMKLGAECGDHYRVTMNCLRGKWVPAAGTLRSDLPAALRAVDLGADPVRLRDRIVEAAVRLPLKSRRAVLRLFDDHTRGARPDGTPAQKSRPLDGSPIRLDMLLEHPETPFAQENAALRLFEQLLMLIRDNTELLDPRQIVVICNDYTTLFDPTRPPTLRVARAQQGLPADRLSAPRWCRKEHRWRLGLARVLTQALTQRAVVPIGGAVKRELRYRPVRIRRAGLYGSIATSRNQLGGPTIPVSPWMEELLMHLGQWPGFVPFSDLVPLKTNFTPTDALAAVRDRLARQARIFGRASNIPIYEIPVRFRKVKKRKDPFTVMLVQTALPKQEDFSAYGMELNDPHYRRRHRRHLSAVLRLILQTIETRATHAAGRRIDLIVLPELSVHAEDLHLIRLLIAKTRAWVFCGIIFEKLKHSGCTVNRGVWLIPTFTQDGTWQTRRLWRFDQGKQHLTHEEQKAGVTSCRDCQWVMVGRGADAKSTWRLGAAICYDATDLRLASDLRDVTDGFIVSALNRDVPTFDNMIAALHYHMFQHVVLVNSGEFGGSSVQAPYIKHYVKNRVHAHGSDQVVISICEMKLLDFRHGAVQPGDPDRKTPPAGFVRGK